MKWKLDERLIDSKYRKRLERRLKERYYFAIVANVGAKLSLGTMIFGLLFPIVFFDFTYKLAGIGLCGLLWSSMLGILANMGWSKSRIVDFVLNRMGSILVITGLTIMTFAPPFLGVLSEELNYSLPVMAIGLLLLFFGMWIQPSSDEI